MKKINFIRLLVLMLVLITSIPQVWADINWTLTSGTRVYFDVTNWDGDNAWFKINLYGTNEAFSKGVTATKLVDHIYYIDLDGSYNGFQICRMEPNKEASQWNYTGTAFAKNRSANDVYMVIAGNLTDNQTPSWGYGPFTMSSGHTFYFNNSVMQVATPNLRIGRTNYCTATAMTTLENGTMYLYSCGTSNWQGYEAITIADKESYTGSNSIYGKGGGNYLVTQTTNHYKASVSTDIYANATESSGSSDGVTYYTTSYSTSLPTYSASISSTSNGTLAVYKYTATSYESNKNSLTNFSAISNGATGLLPTHILKIVTTPNSNCELISLSVSGATKIEDVTGGSTYYVTGDVTISATFGPLYSVSISKNDASMGSVSTSSVLAGSTTHPTITATPNNGYYFVNWTSSTGSVSVASETSVTTTVTASATGTLTANFAKRFVLRGSRSDGSADEGMPGFSTTTADMDISDGISSKEVTLLPNREYKFMIYDLVHSRQCGYTTTNNTLAANTWTGPMNGEYHLLMNTAGYGIYTFEVRVSSADGSGNTWPEVRIINPDSYQISMGYQTKSDGVASASPGDGGSVSAKDGDNYTIENTSWVKSGGSVTFTATPNDGYQFIGWYSSSTTNGEDQDVEAISTENPYTVSGITENKTVYALFKEILFDVNVDDGSGTPDLIQVGIVSHPSITAVKRSGFLFNRWETTGSAVLSDRYANPATINSVSDNQSTVTATYKDLPYIYYDITGPHSKAVSPWQPSTMYVYFYTSAYWDGTYGAGYKNRDKHYGQMEEVDGSNGTLWRYRYDPDTIGTITNVAFIADNQPNYEHFESTGSYCAYHSCNNMFVVTKDAGLSKNAGHSWYYNDDATGKYGYWSNYGETTEARTGLASGFYLNYLTGSSYSEEFVDEDGDGTFELTANLSGSTTYGFYIGGCGGGNWSNKDLTLTATLKSGAFYIYENLNSQFAHITTNVPGYYTFKLTPQKGNGEEPSLTLSVEYPVADGDYRATITRGGKKYTSNTIKSGVSSGTISLWLAQGDNTIAFEVASETAGVISWGSDGSSNQTVNVAKAGVYTMTLVENGTTPRISDVQAYTGKYYIRTDWAPGGWQDYKDNPLIQNTLTYKEGDATTFDYYYCKWISKSGSDANVRFVVANEYNMAISDTLKTDVALDGQEYLPSGYPANVRFSWNSSTNTVNRAYIAGSTNPNDRFLIMHGNVVSGDHKLLTSSGEVINYHSTYNNLNSDEAYFNDKNNWVYQIDLQAKSGAQTYLTARYNGDDRDLYGSSTDLMSIITSSNTSAAYNITVTYDFKTNNLMTAWKPGTTTINETISGIPSVMLLRDHQETADQITIGIGSVEKTTVYGVMKFNKYTLNNQSRNAGHATLPSGGEDARSQFERDLFWISFPFNVNLRDVFGFGEYGKHWIIEYYDGQGRADNGFWADSPSNWKFVTPAMRNNYILEKGVGYILALDLDELGAGSSIWNNSVTDVYLYFPSNTTVTINADKATINVPAHKCNIGPRFTNGDDRRIKDSHWNVIGVPSFANVGGLTSPGTIEGVSYPTGFGFYYQWIMSDNTLSVLAANEETFKTMHAYMVQFTGTINWSIPTADVPDPVAARLAETPDREYKLVLQGEERTEDRTLIRLTDDAAVSNAFEFNYDLSKEYNAGRGNIWTVTADTVEVAGNSMPKPLQTTVVPVGVKVGANGEYTLAMPEGTNGEDVYLIDNAYGTRTNLGLMPYTVTLTAGTYDSRFALEFAPIQETATGVENDGLSRSDELNDGNDAVRKVFVGGRLYILRDGKVYDAAGQRIE